MGLRQRQGDERWTNLLRQGAGNLVPGRARAVCGEQAGARCSAAARPASARPRSVLRLFAVALPMCLFWLLVARRLERDLDKLARCARCCSAGWRSARCSTHTASCTSATRWRRRSPSPGFLLCVGRAPPGQARRPALAAAGALTGLAVVFEYQVVFAAAVIAAYTCVRHRRAAAASLSGGAARPWSCWAPTMRALFGRSRDNPFLPPREPGVSPGLHNNERPVRLRHAAPPPPCCRFSSRPTSGLFVFSPFLLIGLLRRGRRGGPRGPRRATPRGGHRPPRVPVHGPVRERGSPTGTPAGAWDPAMSPSPSRFLAGGLSPFTGYGWRAPPRALPPRAARSWSPSSSMSPRGPFIRIIPSCSTTRSSISSFRCSATAHRPYSLGLLSASTAWCRWPRWRPRRWCRWPSASAATIPVRDGWLVAAGLGDCGGRPASAPRSAPTGASHGPTRRTQRRSSARLGNRRPCPPDSRNSGKEFYASGCGCAVQANQRPEKGCSTAVGTVRRLYGPSTFQRRPVMKILARDTPEKLKPAHARDDGENERLHRRAP